MKPIRRMKHTDLFLLRIWQQDVGDGSAGNEVRIEWAGKIQRVVDGEAREFKDWEALVATLRTMLSAKSPGQPEDNTSDT